MSTTAELITSRAARGWAEERLSDVAARMEATGAHHCAVFEEEGGKFLGIVRLRDVASQGNSAHRILADLVSQVQPLVIRADESAQSTADLFEAHGLSEAVIVDHAGKFLGIATAESVLVWTVRELRRLNAPLRAAGAAEPPAAAGRSHERPPASIPIPVLIVEDHDASRTVLVRVLETRGCRVRAVGSVAEALDAAQRQRFELVISDVGLPDGDGYALMGALQAQHGMACIAMTGFGQEDAARSNRDLNLLAHLTKPLDIRALEAALASLPPGSIQPA